MVYPPAEDSWLLENEVKNYISKLKNKPTRVLDMGSGSGIQALACISSGIKKSSILCADIDKEAVKFLKKSGLIAVHSDLFSKIRGKFGLIIFNPPYLPEDKEEYDKEKDTTAGKKGYETILLFLKQAKQHLSKGGSILLLFSSLSKPRIILSCAKQQGYRAEKLAEKRLFFEKLYVYRMKKSYPLHFILYL